MRGSRNRDVLYEMIARFDDRASLGSRGVRICTPSAQLRTGDIATRRFILRTERSRPGEGTNLSAWNGLRQVTHSQALNQSPEGEFPAEHSVYGVNEKDGKQVVPNQGLCRLPGDLS
jgi:hypothetical protein